MNKKSDNKKNRSELVFQIFLVVVDEPETVQVLTDMLESKDYKVLQAYGG
ncbi:MAG: hypothetical protein V3S72_07235 [Desulfobacterales bacterium]